MSDNLPPEIVSIITDNLRHHPPSLSACSLVCRTWAFSTRHHLFRSLFVRSFNAQSLLTLLDSPLCTFCHHVRGLRLWGDQWGSFQDQQWMNDFIMRLLHVHFHFESVDVLIMEHVNWDAVHADARRVLFVKFAHITKLSIREISFPKFTDFLDLVGSFVCLVDLSIREPDWREQPVSLNSEMALLSPPSLCKLTLGVGDKSRVIDWLLSLPKHTISTLHLHAISYEEKDEIRRLLRALGAVLECLELQFSSWDWGDFAEAAPLRSNTRLRVLTFSELQLQYSRVTRSLELMTATLRDAHAIQELSFAISYPEGRPIDFDWFHLDGVLASKSQLRRVEVRIFCSDIESAERTVRSGVDRCQKKDILDIVWVNK